MNVISKQNLQNLLDGFTKDNKAAEYGGIVYWQTKGAITLLESMLKVYYP